MNALLAILAFAISIGIALFVPGHGATAVILCAVLAVLTGFFVRQVQIDRDFLSKLFVIGLLLRMLVGTLIFTLNLQEFFGGDANTYDNLGYQLLSTWQGNKIYLANIEIFSAGGGWGMLYIVAAVYSIVGRNPLAVQFVNAIIGVATVPLVYLCAHQMFRNRRVARIAALFVTFYPSLVLWSAQGLKDAPIVLLLVLTMYATLRLGEKLNVKFFLVLILSLFGVLSLRFYIFYMVVGAVAGALTIGMRRTNVQSLTQQAVLLMGIGLAMTYFGVLSTASVQLERFGSLESIQQSRSDMARTATSGFGKDVDVSTTTGALKAIPLGMVNLLFAPFPWQLANLRQSITLPEMIVWWASFPLLVLGLWFTIKHQLRQALPILLFTMMLTLSYSVFQGNVGTAYRQRSQLLVFYFIFVAVGFVLFKEKRENERAMRVRQLTSAPARPVSRNI